MRIVALLINRFYFLSRKYVNFVLMNLGRLAILVIFDARPLAENISFLKRDSVRNAVSGLPTMSVYAPTSNREKN